MSEWREAIMGKFGSLEGDWSDDYINEHLPKIVDPSAKALLELFLLTLCGTASVSAEVDKIAKRVEALEERLATMEPDTDPDGDHC